MAKKQTKSMTAGRSRKAPKPDAAVPATWPESKPKKTKERDPRLPAAGTTLTREYKGKTIRVAVLKEGFRFEGEEFRSLSALAMKITGYGAINGVAWFGSTKRPATPKAETAKETETPTAPAKARAPKRAAKVRRAGRDPQVAAPTESAPEPVPVAESATA